MVRTRLIALSLLFFCAGGQAAPGFRQVELSDSAGSPLSVAIWYPAIQQGKRETVGENAAFVGVSVIPDASPIPGRHPLVVISHGYNGSWRNLSWLAAALAAQGYIVAAPDHPGTTTFDQNPDAAKKLWRRPRELSRVIDFISLHSDLAGAADTTRIAAIGHSLGGWTVLSLAGARFDPSLFLSNCQRFPRRGDCRLTNKLGMNEVAAQDRFSDLRDSRIGAVVSLDAGLATGFTSQSLTRMTLPILILAAGNDSLGELPAAQESAYIADNLPASLHHYRIVKGATHFSFMQLCKPGGEKLIDEASPGDGIVCQDDRGADRRALHQQLTSQITLFLQSALNYPAPADDTPPATFRKAAGIHD